MEKLLKKQGKLSPSLMCADLMNVESTLRVFEKCGIEMLHVDIMDGVFVPNYTLGPDFCKCVRRVTDIPLDIHLMVENPEKCVEIFGLREGERMSFHPSASSEPRKVIDKIHACGAKAFVAIEPSVPLSVLDSFADVIDGVVIMTVNPGFAGQKLIPKTLDKVAECREKFAAAGRDIEIEVDGNVSFENAPKMRAAGADIFVCGTSSVFSKSGSIEANTERMRTLIK